MAEPKAPATEAPASAPAPPPAVNSAPSFDWQTFKPQESFKSLLHIYEKVESDGESLAQKHATSAETLRSSSLTL